MLALGSLEGVGMQITISRSEASDRPAILALLAEARGDDLSDDERARQGFIQGQIDEPMLARFQAGSGVFIARDGETLAGVCMTSMQGAVDGGPPAETITAVAQAMPEVSPYLLFLYGPAAVDRRYQGQGLLTQLLVEVCTALQDQFELGAVFVERTNQKSLAIHRHYPMEESTDFTFKERSYVVFTFSPKQVVSHYC